VPVRSRRIPFYRVLPPRVLVPLVALAALAALLAAAYSR